MPSIQVTANTVAQELWAEVNRMKGKPSSVVIDNQGGAPNTIAIEDYFTPDASHGDSAPGPQTLLRIQETVGAGATSRLSGDELKDIEFLGLAQATGSVVDALCVIIVAYDLI